jgi:hypothetical protein
MLLSPVRTTIRAIAIAMIAYATYQLYGLLLYAVAGPGIPMPEMAAFTIRAAIINAARDGTFGFILLLLSSKLSRLICAEARESTHSIGS